MQRDPMPTILIAEDQTLILDAIATLLSLEDDIEIFAKCENGQKAQEYLTNNKAPDIILSDIEMPQLDGLALAEWAMLNCPNSKFVIMTTFAKPGYVQRAITLGVKGFILKEASSDYLLNSLYKIMKGERVIDPELAIMALDEKDPLSKKERKALFLAGDGMKTKDIAQTLFLSEGTVRNYLSEAIAKLNATNRVDAARIARQKGWL
ncbi:MAG: two-component system response regulator DesR [Kangiellaceae bacterium]|jgi:two-component system response regulator DesR